MKESLIPIFLILVAIELMTPACLHASNLTIQSYHPSVHGSYNILRFIPRTANLTQEPCAIGTMYVNSSGVPSYCFNSGAGLGKWGNPPEIWTQNGDNIYLTDTATNQNLTVGIGTSTPVFKLTLQNDASTIIAKGTFGGGAILPDAIGAGSRLIWYPRKAAFRAGYVDNDQWDDANIGNYSVAMGKNTTAAGDYSIAAGGENNTTTYQYATLIGGQDNTANANYVTLLGGKNNSASGLMSSIYGGLNNQITNQVGWTNSEGALIMGGKDNQVNAEASVVGGGENNIVSTQYSYIGGGFSNLISGITPVVSLGNYSVIGGGSNNKVQNTYSVILGGENNTIMGPYSTIGGGGNNTIGTITGLKGNYSGISGGESNMVTGDSSIIGGGKENTISANYGFIGGGTINNVTGNFSNVGGGERNTASGLYSMIMGGTDNIAAGDYSWAAGRYLQLSANADRSFAWGYSDDSVNPIIVNTPDVFVIAPGKIAGATWNPFVGIQDRTPAAVLEVNANSSLTDNYLNITNPGQAGGSGNVLTIKNNGYIGVQQPTPTDATHLMQFGNANGAFLSTGGVWTNASSRKFKENITPLTSQAAEDTLDQLSPVTFNYKTTQDQQNIGFIAEDVPDLVAMKGRKSLSAMDIVAVLTKTIQDQEEHIQKHKKDMQEIRTEIQKMKEKLN